MRKRWLATGILVALVLAGCGDDDDDSTAATAATAATTVASATGAATTEASSATTAGSATTAASNPATTAASATTGASAATTAAPTATSAAGGSAAPPATSGGSAASGSPTCEAVGDIATAATTLDYTLSEFKIDGPTTAPAGQIGFQLDNTGNAAHEIEIIKADDYDTLPKNDAGTIQEGQLPAGAKVGKIERFPSKSQCSGVFDLQPGTYQLVCNIEFQNGPQVISHAGRGMHLALTVT